MQRDFEKTVQRIQMPPPFISVIIPVYNVELWLAETLDSVLAQSLKEIEIICVNDGSTDGSREILSRYAAADPRIKIIDRENGGLSAARNTGLDAAAGCYVYFLDSDDMIEKDTLSHCYDEMQCGDLDLLFFGGRLHFENEAVYRAHRKLAGYYRLNGNYPTITNGKDLFQRMIYFTDFVSTVSLQMANRFFLNENNLRFQEGILHEDNIYTFLCLMAAGRVKLIPDVLFVYRIREGSITTAQKGLRHVEGLLAGMREVNRWRCANRAQVETCVSATQPTPTTWRCANRAQVQKGGTLDAAIDQFLDLLLNQAVMTFNAMDLCASNLMIDATAPGHAAGAQTRPHLETALFLTHRIAIGRSRALNRRRLFLERAFRYLIRKKRGLFNKTRIISM